VYWAWYDPEINRYVPDAGNLTNAAITAWRNVNTSQPFDVDAATNKVGWGSEDTSVSIDGVTTVTDEARIVLVTSAGDNVSVSSWANANLESITEVLESQSSAGDDSTLAIAHGEMASAGDVGSTTASVSASEQEANVCIALRSADYVEAGGSTFTASLGGAFGFLFVKIG
jgi:hypothetical protein